MTPWRPPELEGEDVRTAAPEDPARVMARAILRRAERQARRLEDEARRRGELRGAEEARAREEAALRRAAQTLADAAGQLQARAAALAEGLETLLPRAAVTLAERVLGRALAQDADALAAMVRDAVAAALPADRVTVRLHPADLATLTRAGLRPELDGAPLRLETATHLAPGEFEVDTGEAFVVDGIRRRLERALALLAEEAAP